LQPAKILPLVSRMAAPTRKFEYGAWAFFMTLRAAASSFSRIADEGADLGIEINTAHFTTGALGRIESCAIVNPGPKFADLPAECLRFGSNASGTRVFGLPAVQSNTDLAESRIRQGVFCMPLDHPLSNLVPHSTAEVDTRSPGPTEAIATLNGHSLLRNSGIPLELNWVQEVRVNTSAVERRAQTEVARRTVKKEWQAAWLLRAISCMDLTTLSGDDTDERVRRLCAKARHPVQPELVERLGIERLGIQVAAVCVYHLFVETALQALAGSGIHVAAVSAGFPAGLSPFAERVAEIRRSAEAGAHEIDVVITRGHVFGARWQALYDEIATFKQACGSAHMKVILGSGDLLTLRNVARASFVAMMAGADFIKTSTGKEPSNATLPVSLVMVRAIREYAQRTGMAVGFKPAGGIRTAKQSLDWLALMKEELGDSWLRAEMFRFGASGLLGDIERQLEHHATGRYSAEYRHPVA
jgi:deoxyribose-phosphate aldolase